MSKKKKTTKKKATRRSTRSPAGVPVTAAPFASVVITAMRAINSIDQAGELFKAACAPKEGDPGAAVAATVERLVAAEKALETALVLVRELRTGVR